MFHTEKIKWKIYHFIHTHGFIADVIYWGAFYVRNFLRKFQFKKISKNHITPEELFQYRGIDSSSGILTGITNICNAKCTFCAYPKVVSNKTLKTGVMPFEVFKKVVDEWTSLNGKTIDLTPVVGDPLVDPNIMEKINYAVVKGLKLSFTTNAILINRDETYKKLIDSGVNAIYISTQGTNKEAYEKIYGVQQFDKVISGIHNLLLYNRLMGEPVKIVIRFRNEEKPSQIINSSIFKNQIRPYLSEKVCINFTVDFDNWGGLITSEDMGKNMRLRTLPPMINIPCQALFGFTVKYDGDVRLCGCRLTKSDEDDLVVGNIYKKSLKEISKSDEAWKIIKGFYEGKRPQVCDKCTFYQPINKTWMEDRKNNKIL